MIYLKSNLLEKKKSEESFKSSWSLLYHCYNSLHSHSESILESFKEMINNPQEAQSFENSIAYNSALSKWQNIYGSLVLPVL